MAGVTDITAEAARTKERRRLCAAAGIAYIPPPPGPRPPVTPWDGHVEDVLFSDHTVEWQPAPWRWIAMIAIAGLVGFLLAWQP